MKAQWIWMLAGAAILAFAMGDSAQAQGYGFYGGYANGGYNNGGYTYQNPSYGVGNPSFGTYGYPGYFNRTEQYHYTHPRITTGYGFVNRPLFYGRGGYGGGYYGSPGYGYGYGGGRGLGGGVRVYNYNGYRR